MSDNTKAPVDDGKRLQKKNMPALNIANIRGTTLTQDFDVSLRNIKDSKIKGVTSTFKRNDSVAPDSPNSPEQAQASIMLGNVEGVVIMGKKTTITVDGSDKADIAIFSTTHEQTTKTS